MGELERNGIQKTINLNDTSFTVLRSSMSKQSLKSNSSQNMIKEKVSKVQTVKISSHETKNGNTSAESALINRNVSMPREKHIEGGVCNPDISVLSKRTEARPSSNVHSKNVDVEPKKEKTIKNGEKLNSQQYDSVNQKKLATEKSNDKIKQGRPREENKRENLIK